MHSAPFKTRFAPSPTGLLHLGNIRTALFNVLLAKRHGGVFLLRIEDTDLDRSHADHSAALMQDMRWLGLNWQEGEGVGGAHAPYLQSQRGPIYLRYFALLEQKGLAYPCFCSDQQLSIERKTQLAAGRPPRYSGRCRSLTAARVEERIRAGESPSLRFRVPSGETVEFEDKVRGPQRFATDDIGDFVIRRSTGAPAFFFSNAIDDALMGVSFALRGEDHLTNTPRQILLLKALALPVPDYGHIALVVGPDDAPLAKRHGSRTVRELREQGFVPAAINNYLARLGHTYSDNRFMSLDELAAGFEVAHLGRAPAHFDETQLLRWQHEAVHRACDAELWIWMGAAVHALVPERAWQTFVEAVRANVGFPADALKWARVVYSDEWALSAGAHAAILQAPAGFFSEALRLVDQHSDDFKSLSEALKQATGAKGKNLFQPLRAALTGELDGPEMVKLLPLIGGERVRRRIQFASSELTVKNEK